MTESARPETPAVLIDESRLARRVSELAAEISADFAGRDLVLICTLGGATVFYADLARQLTVPASHLFLGFRSYPGKAGTAGEVQITQDLSEPLEGRHAILLEGTIVSGRTPQYIMDLLRRRQPASLKLCTLLLKRDSLRVPLQADYIGFELPNEHMAIGYGMGHGAGERGLPYIGAAAAH
jgi:hypoxanthine phosphoribosyltransferase